MSMPTDARSLKCDGGHSKREALANALLIAAAPDLFNALVGAAHALRSYQYGNAVGYLAREVADSADAAIDKAKGIS